MLDSSRRQGPSRRQGLGCQGQWCLSPFPLPALTSPLRCHACPLPHTRPMQASFFTSLTWASLVIILSAFIQPGVKPSAPLYTYLLWLGAREGCLGAGLGAWV